MNVPVRALAHAPWSLCRNTKSLTGQLNHRYEHPWYPRQANVAQIRLLCGDWKEMYACQMGGREREREKERERHRTVHMCLNCLLLRQANIPLGGSGYPNTTNRSALFSFSSPNFSTWSSFHVSQARREEGEAFADAYTRAFSPPMSHTSPGTFSCCEPLIDSFISPAICNSLSLPPLEGHIAAFPAFIKWRMRRCGHRRCPPAGKHTYL